MKGLNLLKQEAPCVVLLRSITLRCTALCGGCGVHLVNKGWNLNCPFNCRVFCFKYPCTNSINRRHSDTSSWFTPSFLLKFVLNDVVCSV